MQSIRYATALGCDLGNSSRITTIAQREPCVWLVGEVQVVKSVAEDQGSSVATASRVVAFSVLGLAVFLVFVLMVPAGAASVGSDVVSVPSSGPVPPAGVGVGGVVAQGGGLCDSSGVAQFGDVSVGDYGAAYVLCMRALGLSLGTGDGTYGPDRELTRGQMASFLVRLWRDVLGMGCPEGGTPFTDVGGGVHADNIECLYNLGITLGKTATSYAPGSDLTSSQISRFLFRTYEKAGRSCEDRESELDEALACLEALRVIPSAVEGRSDRVVTRAQMAVYVIGLWHNLAGRGLPPVPTAFGAGSGVGPEDGVSDPDEVSDVLEGPDDGDAGEPIDGDWVIPVFVCAPAGKYTAADLGEWTAVLNDELDGYFERLSAGRMTLRFTQGSVLSDDIDWENTTLGMLVLDPVYPCGEEATSRSGTSQVLIFTDVDRGGDGVGGYARRHTGPAVVPTPAKSENVIALITVVHELGHSVLGLSHLKEYEHGDVFINEINTRASLLRNPSLACSQYEQLGWPVPDYAQPCTRLTPSIPESLSHGPTDNGQYTVTWEPPRFSNDTPVTGYTIKIYTDIGELYAEHEQTADERSYSIEPGDYHVSVRANTRYGEGDFDSVRLKIAPVPPPFGPIRITSTASTTISLVWNTESHKDFRDEESAGIRYEVQYSANGMTSSVETWGRNRNFDTLFALSELDQDTEYSIKVRACSVTATSRNCTAWKTVVASTGSVLPPPDPISVISGSDWYLLTWEPVPGAESYQVVLPHLGYDSSYTPEYGSFHNVDPNTTYSLKVRSCSSSTICEGESTEVTFTTTAEETIPRPYDISLKEAGDSWVTVDWNNLGGRAWDYRMEYEYTDGVTDSGLLDHRQSYGPLRLVVEPDRTYSLKIRNCELPETNRSCSAWAVFKFTFPVTSSAVPPSVRVTDIGDIWLEFSWDRAPGAVSYDFRYQKTGDVSRVLYDRVEPPLGLIDRLEPDTMYTAEVRSCGKPTEPCSGWTTTTLSTSRSLPPAPPSYPVSVRDVTDTRIRVVWDQPQSDQHLDLKWYPTEERGRTTVRVGQVYSHGLAEKVLSGLEPDTAYTIAVRTCRTGGETPCDNWVTIQATTRPSS